MKPPGGHLLPFLKSKKEVQPTGLMVKTRIPDEKPAEDQNDESAGCEACASELIRAIHAKDAQAVVQAIKDILELIDTPSADDDSFESQNIKAASDGE